MPELFRDWDGGDWKEHVARLLHARYAEPGMYREIPSRANGDLGLEGFSHDGISREFVERESASWPASRSLAGPQFQSALCRFSAVDSAAPQSGRYPLLQHHLFR